MQPLTDEQQAEAVIDGLRQAITCDECGAVHKHGKLRTYPAYRYNGSDEPRDFAECSCGRGHSTEINCGCGTMLAWGPKRGWRSVRRKHNTWQKREKRFLARIAELEALLNERNGSF